MQLHPPRPPPRPLRASPCAVAAPGWPEGGHALAVAVVPAMPVDVDWLLAGVALAILAAILARRMRARRQRPGVRRPPATASHVGTPAGRILVAEDHPINRAVISRQLHRLGYRHALVENGEQALQALAHGHYDLLLTDCHMPLLDGYALARRIRAGERGGYAHLPIVALSASASADPVRQCGESGMDGFLGKPVRLADLQRELARHLGPAGNDDAGPRHDMTVDGVAAGGDSASSARLDALAAAFGSARRARRALRQLLSAGRRDLDLLDRALDAGDHARQRELLHRIDGALRVLGWEGDDVPPTAGNRERRHALARQLDAIAQTLARPRAGRTHGKEP